jgi:hypothetical protein
MFQIGHKAFVRTTFGNFPVMCSWHFHKSLLGCWFLTNIIFSLVACTGLETMKIPQLCKYFCALLLISLTFNSEISASWHINRTHRHTRNRDRMAEAMVQRPDDICQVTDTSLSVFANISY